MMIAFEASFARPMASLNGSFTGADVAPTDAEPTRSLASFFCQGFEKKERLCGTSLRDDQIPGEERAS